MRDDAEQVWIMFWWKSFDTPDAIDEYLQRNEEKKKNIKTFLFVNCKFWRHKPFGISIKCPSSIIFVFASTPSMVNSTNVTSSFASTNSQLIDLLPPMYRLINLNLSSCEWFRIPSMGLQLMANGGDRMNDFSNSNSSFCTQENN